MRLIDADKLKKGVLDLRDCYNGFSDTYDKACIIGVIDEQPTIEPEDRCGECDAWNQYKNYSRGSQPEIIRCKDCKHWKTQVKGVKGDGLGCCNFHKANFVTGEGFCYWAERRKE